MKPPHLARVLAKAGPELTTALEQLVGPDGAIAGRDDTLLVGTATSPWPLTQLMIHEHCVGGVRAKDPEPARLVLQAFLVGATERRSLVSEALDRYRELNLLYGLSDHLAGAESVAATAVVALDEATRLIDADASSLLIVDAGGALTCVAGVGDAAPWHQRLAQDRSESLIADVTDNIDTTTFPGAPQGSSAVYAPVGSADLQGWLVLSRTGRPYRSGDLKLLVAVASQTGPAMATAAAREAEKQRAAAEADVLRREIRDLRIELDQSRQEAAVREITGSDYFQSLRSRSASLRAIIDGDE